MNKYFIGIILFSLHSLVYSEEYKIEYKDVPSYEKGEPIWYQEHRLYRSYLDHSESRLSQFFLGWSQRSIPITDKNLEKLPAAFQHAYAIFEDFYQPKNLGRIGDPEWGKDQFSKVSYFITQPTIDVVVTKNIVKDIHSNGFSNSIYSATLKDFRPRIKGDTKALFLDDYHSYLIKEFLGDEEIQAGHSGIMSTSKAVGESERKQKFLNQYVQIYHGHWGGWRFATDPTITVINFNEKFEKAVVHFSLVYQGGEAEYKFKGGKWILVKSELTWIT